MFDFEVKASSNLSSTQNYLSNKYQHDYVLVKNFLTKLATWKVEVTHFFLWFSIISHPLGTFKVVAKAFWRNTANSSPPNWDIENPDIFRTLACWEHKAYSKSCQTSMMEYFAKIVNDHNYFCNISFSPSLLYEINMNFSYRSNSYSKSMYI